MGLIRVGPDSTGAEPGPVCYGRGGSQPTITDANLILGYLNPDFFNGGAMRLQRDAFSNQSPIGDLGIGTNVLSNRASGWCR
jgi:N-methylhydantoinase A/oxoprolinase/acetone carboxylase beta subunit